LEEVMLRYDLQGVAVTTSAGHLVCRVGAFDHPELRGLCIAPEGYRPWIPSTPEQFAEANLFLDGKLLPQMATQGNATAYFVRPSPEHFAVFATVWPKMDVREQWATAKRVAQDISNIAFGRAS
jgi:hypothetical protein